ncbi:hypothetical protein EZS27_005864 [termite gut metagenome]|uniref:Uncharacterized protein n=1 Tax=termite gut metagenome TaxID=433724 RepID=A0A5J4SKE0_9ZZZZ
MKQIQYQKQKELHSKDYDKLTKLSSEVGIPTSAVIQIIE